MACAALLTATFASTMVNRAVRLQADLARMCPILRALPIDTAVCVARPCKTQLHALPVGEVLPRAGPPRVCPVLALPFSFTFPGWLLLLLHLRLMSLLLQWLLLVSSATLAFTGACLWGHHRLFRLLLYV